jgi:hypothetical protein
MVRLPAVTHRVPYGLQVQGPSVTSARPEVVAGWNVRGMFEVGRRGEQEEAWAADRVSPQGPLRPRPAAPHPSFPLISRSTESGIAVGAEVGAEGLEPPTSSL